MQASKIIIDTIIDEMVDNGFEIYLLDTISSAADRVESIVCEDLLGQSALYDNNDKDDHAQDVDLITELVQDKTVSAAIINEVDMYFNGQARSISAFLTVWSLSGPQLQLAEQEDDGERGESQPIFQRIFGRSAADVMSCFRYPVSL